jgi:uracil-DNA glycosylase
VSRPVPLKTLAAQVSKCTLCADELPCPPNPVLRVEHPAARLLVIGQAPGRRAHESHTPWNDASGERLRMWLDVSREEFYDTRKIAIMPMGFCYPGKGTSGDLPPPPLCAPAWHGKIRAALPNIELTLLIGQYAHAYYLGNRRKATLGGTVHAWREYVEEGFMPLVHPSPRNTRWLRKNPWFEQEIVPCLQARVAALLK